MANRFHYETDQFWHLEDGTYRFELERLNEAHTWCRKMVTQALYFGADVVVSNTFTRRSEITPFVKIGKEHGAKLQIIECRAPFGSIHGVPQETLDRMAERWYTIVQKDWEEWTSAD